MSIISRFTLGFILMFILGFILMFILGFRSRHFRLNLGFIKLQTVYCVERKGIYFEVIKPNGDCLAEWPREHNKLLRNEPTRHSKALEYTIEKLGRR